MKGYGWRGLACLLGGALLALGVTAQAADPSLRWQTLESAHFRIHFHDGGEATARRALALAERAHTRLAPLLDWTPTRRTDIVLSDKYDLANGFAAPLPFNHIFLYVSPPDGLRSIPDFDDWLELLITHEYTHTLHLDQAEGLPLALRQVFGRHPLLFPHLFQPTWLIEGLATHLETDPGRGVGRGQSSLYAMLMRMEVDAGLKPLDQVSMDAVGSWPAGRIPYLYGVYFFRFVEARHGPDALQELLRHYRGNLLPYQVHGNLRQVLGQSGHELWAEFAAYLQEQHAPRLAAIRAAGVVAGERLSHHGHATGSPQALADGSVYYLRDDGLRRPMLMRREAAGGHQAITPLRAGARLHAHPRQGVLVAQPELCDNHNLYYDLYRIAPADGRPRRLTHCGRYRHAAWLPEGDGILAVAVTMGQSRLERLDAEGRRQALLWQGEADEVIGQLDVAADGASAVAAVWRRARGWGLERFHLATGSWETLLGDGALIGEPRFSADGASVLFSSDHGGVFNLRRLDLDDGRLVTLSHVEGGAFQPSQASPAGPIYYIGYGADGYDLYRLPATATARPLPPAPPARSPLPPVEPATGNPRPYRPWRSLAPTAWTPVLVLGPQHTELGVSSFGMDALRVHEYLGYLSYDSDQELWAGAVRYGYDHRYHLFAGRDHSYAYADDELQRVRRRDRLQAQLTLPRLRLDYRLAGHLGLGTEVSDDRWLATPAAARGEWRDNFLGTAVSFDNSRSLPRAISRRGGRELRLIAETSDAFDGDFPGQAYTLDWREYLPLGTRQVLALRYLHGLGSGQARPFELGGTTALELAPTGTPALFNRRDYPLRGYPSGLPALSGGNAQLLSAEWRFPLARLERGLLVPPAGLRQLSGGLFVDAGAAWEDGGGPERYYSGAGIELIADATLLYRLPLRLRLGFAHGFADLGENQLYLTLGRR